MIGNSRQALVGDIGATNVRLAIADFDELTSDHLAVLRSSMFSDPLEAISGYLKTIPACPKFVSLAVAGPVGRHGVQMTNLPWTVTREDIADLTGAEHVCLINDFEAQALALPHLRDTDLLKIGGGTADPDGVKVAVGAGTGLGVAGLVACKDGWKAISGEGGHAGFAFADMKEVELVAEMGFGEGHISWERLVSGPGLVRLHAALARRAGGKPDGKAPDVRRIIDQGLVHREPVCLAAVEQFVTWLGRLAGDLALIHGAKGGVYVGGGIPPRLAEALTTGTFRQAFAAKGRMSAYVDDIPVFLIKAADAGLRGASIALSRSLAA